MVLTTEAMVVNDKSYTRKDLSKPVALRPTENKFFDVLFKFIKIRRLWGSNSRGMNPTDFKSVALTTRPRRLYTLNLRIFRFQRFDGGLYYILFNYKSI